MDAFKILKLRNPIAIYEQFTISHRKQTMLISTTPADNFIARSTKIWNIITPKLKLPDYSSKISFVKNTLKNSLLVLQISNDPTTWISNDFDLAKISTTSDGAPVS
jgi:hypothetical protein